ATAGDNLTKPSDNTPWYDGVPLLSYLENVDITEAQAEEGFYLPVQHVCRPNHTFRGFQGQIESGEIRVGDTITVQPSGEQANIKSILIGDRNAETAAAGAPVTVQLDREIDVSRGCVLTKDNHIASGKAFQATLLWMDDAPLTEGKEYFVRIGTRLLPGIVHRIRYQTDVNTGEQLPASSLSKNGIALCDISVDDEIPIDTFGSHKALGELLLIDRVTNMTSACGVVEEIVHQEDVDRSVRFRKGDLEVKSHLFETFFFQIESGSMNRYDPEAARYEIGDALPLSGVGYVYPQNFDILSLSGKAAILIRDGKVADLFPLEEYKVTNHPIVNGRGFEIRVGSQEDLEEFLRAYQEQNEGEQFSRWLRFETYRRIMFRCGSDASYII
ncbi:MAG: sulfate adenylyltransferase, partial [Butyricicoccaceae bacterium]